MSFPLQEKLEELLRFAKANRLTEVIWQEGTKKVSFRRQSDEVSPVLVQEEPVEPEQVSEKPEETVVRSPIVGTFRRADSKNHPPFVMEGNHIKPGDRVAIVECMKIPTDVNSFCDGVIKEIIVDDGQAVEYGQPLFVVTPVSSVKTNGVS